jgi:hypothetical protein
MVTQERPLVEVRIVSVHLIVGIVREKISPAALPFALVFDFELVDAAQKILGLNEVH